MPELSIDQILTAASALERRTPMPVCNGCPPGHFAKQCWEWVALLAASLSTPGERYQAFGLDNGQHYGIQRPGELLRENTPRATGWPVPPEMVLVASVTPHPGGGKTLTVAPHPVPAPPPEFDPDRVDRIQQLLDAQAETDKKLAELRIQIRMNAQAQQEMLQRCMLFIHHFGKAPWFGGVRLPWWLGGEREVHLRRPMVKEDTVKPSIGKDSAPTPPTSRSI